MPFPVHLSLKPELIFVTDITDFIHGEKNCHVEKFRLSILNLNNLWSFIEVLAVFFQIYVEKNLCGENLCGEK